MGLDMLRLFARPFFAAACGFALLTGGQSGLVHAAELVVGGAWAELDSAPSSASSTSDSRLIAERGDLTLDVPVSFVTDSNLVAATDLTIGYTLPAFGVFNVSAPATVNELGPFQSQSRLAGLRNQDVQGQYATTLFGSQIGVFGEVTDQPTAFALEPQTSRKVGASVGYGGFYLSGAFQSAGSDGLIDSRRAWQAGFGYGSSAFDVRLTYAESDFAQTGLMELEGKQWMIGGLVQLTPSILLDANAFYVDREQVVPTVEPPGTGARVGVRLRF